MPGFLHFLPDHHGDISPEILAAAGVGHAFAPDASDAVPSACREGPGGRPGTVVGVGDPAGVGYFPQRQKWGTIPGSGAWLGRYTDRPLPGPDDLARPELLPGYPLRLADGRLWRVPLALETADGSPPDQWQPTLPRSLTLDARGEYAPGPVLPRYAELNALAEAFLDQFRESLDGEGRPQSFTFNETDAALRVLQANYRLGRVELCELGLFTFDGPEQQHVLLWLIDFPGWIELQKKTASAAPATTAGAAD